MFLPSEVKTEVIFHNVITGGMIDFARNSAEKRRFAMNVRIPSEQDLILIKLFNTC